MMLSKSLSNFSLWQTITTILLCGALFLSSSPAHAQFVGNCLYEGDGCTICDVGFPNINIVCPDLCGPGRDFIYAATNILVDLIESCSVTGCVSSDDFPQDQYTCFKVQSPDTIPDRSEMEWVCSDVCPTATTASPITEVPTEAPITPAPTLSPITEAPTQVPVTEAPTRSPITNTPTVAPVAATTPTSSPVSEAPTQAPIVNTRTIAPVAASAPTPAPITNTRTMAPVVGSAPTPTTTSTTTTTTSESPEPTRPAPVESPETAAPAETSEVDSAATTTSNGGNLHDFAVATCTAVSVAAAFLLI